MVRRQWIARYLRAGLVLGIYSAASLLLFGRGVIMSPTTTVVGDAGADKTIAMWSLVWWPHALVRGHDPFVADVVWAPEGIDLAWVTAIPGPSLAFSWLTASLGPVATYNMLALLGVALSAWAAYLLAVQVTRSFWPSVVAGWVFGFSAYQVGHLIGHLNLVLVFFVPLCALLLVRHFQGDLRTRTFVVLLTAALVGQFLTSTEIFATLVLTGQLFGLLSVWRFDATDRVRLRATILAALAAVGLACVIVSPYLVHAFVLSGAENAPLRSPFQASADVLNYVVPTRRIWLRPSGSEWVTDRFTATGAERGAYLGIPLLLIVVAAAARRGDRARSVLALGLVGIAVASLGAEMRVAGYGLFPGPWKPLAAAPVTNVILPVRLTLYVSLLAGLAAALWLSEAGRRRAVRWLIAAVAIVVAFPDPAARLWKSPVPRPNFFTTNVYERHIDRGETVLVLPYGPAGWSLLWQAEEGLRFRLVGGHMGRRVTPAEERWREVHLALGRGSAQKSVIEQLRPFLRAHDVRTIIVAPDTPREARRLIEALGIRPLRVADTFVYKLSTVAAGYRTIRSTEEEIEPSVR